jgi:predicted HTH domain antitoxin
MAVKSIRIPEELEQAIDYVARAEKIGKANSFRELTRMGFGLYVAKSYERGKISLREASKLLNLTLSETIDLLMETGVKGNIRVKDVMDSLKTLPSKPGVDLHILSLHPVKQKKVYVEFKGKKDLPLSVRLNRRNSRLKVVHEPCNKRLDIRYDVPRSYKKN